jgi:predicted RNA-binding protein with PIN domain
MQPWQNRHMPYWFDGNNLIGQTASEASLDRKTRRAFLKHLSSCSRTRGGRFLVFFDGDDPDRAMPPPGVQVRYSAPLSADDDIMRRLEGTSTVSDIIVVTNDQALTTRCRNAGAKTMTWAHFNRATRPRAGVEHRRTGENTRIQVDEWVRFFGFDNDSLE